MNRRVALAGSVSFSLVLALGGAVRAAAPPVDASQDTIVCNTVLGTVSIKPPLIAGGTATSTAIGVKGTLNGCTVSGPNAVTVLSGSFSAKLTGTSNNCSTLLGAIPITGPITIKWKTVEKLVSATSVVNATQLTGGLFTGDSWGAAYGQFSIGGAGVSVTGSFAGTDGGATSTAVLVTSEDAQALGNACADPKGLKAVHVGIGVLNLK